MTAPLSITIPVLALDLGTKTGWAFGVPGSRPESGSVKFSGNLAERLDQFDNWLANFCTIYVPGLIAIEQPNIVRTSDLNGPLSSIGLTALAILIAHRREVLWQLVPSKAAAKTFTGNGGGSSGQIKERNLSQAHALGWTPQTADEADALAVWFHACQEIVPKVEKVA